MAVQVINADCRTALAGMEDESVNCVVTSPPYFGLRDYGVDGQIGLEPTPDEFVTVMVEVFREVRRVLKKDGTCWLNLGDSYANDGKWGGSSGGKHVTALHGDTGIGRGKRQTGLKPKDLIGIPWRVALALQADGWYLRQDIIWNKPNPMPESVRDRCTKAHEYIFLLTKSARYFYDSAAVAEGRSSDEDGATFRGGCYVGGAIDNSTMGKRQTRGNKRIRGVPPRHAAYPESSDQSGLDAVERGLGRNRRSVWTIATVPYREAHFATFPPELVEVCIKAGCPIGGTVLDPFGGAGTTGLVADRLQREAVLIELNPEYCEMARRRISGDAGMFGEVG